MKYSLVAALVAASVALAEPVDPNTIDPCLKNCAETAATAGSVGCSSIFDTACVCGKKDAFVAAATPCVLSGCADKAAEAISMVSTLCTEGIKGGEQSSAAPEPTSEEPKPSPSSEAPPAPSSDAGEQSSAAPEPTSSAGEATPSAGGEGETIEGLSPCASKCMVEGAAKQGCKGQDDTACICTDAFKTAVTPCVAACGADDVTAALALSAKKCAAGAGSATPSGGASASGSAGPAPTSGGSGDKEPECDPRGGSGACAKKYTEPATLTKAEDKTAETSQAAAAGAEADAAKQGSGAKALTTGAALTIAGVIAAALF